jgi:hypothetical protein
MQQPIPGRATSLSRGSWRQIPANDFMLVLDPKRIGISRGLPWTHHGQNSAITMMDLKTLEESAAYLNAFFGAVITTPTGEIPEGFEREIFKRRFSKTDENKTGAAEDETTSENYRKYLNFMGGSLIPVLQEGEKLDMVKSERPSLTFTGFMDWLVNDIAWGFGIPPAFVWAIAGRTGPETRLTLNQAVKRNVERFPSDFMFQLTSDETRRLRSQIVTAKPGRGGRRAHPDARRWRDRHDGHVRRGPDARARGGPRMTAPDYYPIPVTVPMVVELPRHLFDEFADVELTHELLVDVIGDFCASYVADGYVLDRDIGIEVYRVRKWLTKAED